VTPEGRAVVQPGARGSTRLRTFDGNGRRTQLALWSVAGALALGCNRESDRDRNDRAGYGDPLGIELEGRPPAPPLAIAFAVKRGRDPRPLVSSLASAFEAVARRCPDFDGAIAGGDSARLELRATKSAVTTTLSSARGGACVKSVLDGQVIALDSPEPMDVLVEVRLRSGAASR
jgi:hypothetical protein